MAKASASLSLYFGTTLDLLAVQTAHFFMPHHASNGENKACFLEP